MIANFIKSLYIRRLCENRRKYFYIVKNPYFKTFSAKPSDIQKKWVLIDAEGQTLGRLSTQIAMILRGKTKPQYTPHMDTGDNVVVINAEKIHLTGKKRSDKQYFSYTGYPGGGKFTTPAELFEKKPTEVLRKAVKGMLPKNSLGRELMRNLRIYAGPVHEQTAQNPEKITV
jgi:large subunit ribosomal protein L13